MLAALVLFISAFLLFAVQPYLGKSLLPLIGGTPAGWLTLLVFFQLVLLAGYALAFVLSHRSPRVQAVVVFAILLLGIACLPPQILPERSLQGPGDILLMLLPVIGIPALALSMLSSTVQRLVADGGRNPYLLYAASNAGSLLGLVSYPLVVEPYSTLSQQGLFWGAGYMALLVLVAGIFAGARSGPGRPLRLRCGRSRWLYWLALSAVPASLSYGLVSYITIELGAFPLFWIVPLALYLVSFIIAFGSKTLPVRLMGNVTAGIVLLSVTIFLAALGGLPVNDWALLFLWGLVFFLLATSLHTRLAASRPGPEALSEYYLCLALGGALGGLCNVFVVPFVFVYPVEFFIAMGFALMLLDMAPRPAWWLRRLSAVTLAGVTILSVLVGLSPLQSIQRNFFGTALVYEAEDANGNLIRYLTTGAGFQGSQQIGPFAVTVPQLYFTPLQSFFAARQFAHVGMLGLGAGMALCFNRPGRDFTVYEVDPKIRVMAERNFTYISSCGEPEWRMGDARVELTRDTQKRFDVLLIDAFQGVNIPLHLLTREAFALYRSRLAPEGLLLYNTNSLYYDLTEQISAQAHEAGWQIWQAPSSWVVLAAPGVSLEWLQQFGWQPVPPSATRVWSDARASPLQALRH